MTTTPAGPPANDSALPRVAVFGAGAVGCHFGAKLAQAGARVTLIGRPAHVQAIRERGLVFESGGTRHAVPIGADTQPECVRDADLVLVCVKSRDTEDAARTIAPLARPGAIVLSMQNGVDNAERLRTAAAVDALAAVVYVGASMAGPGHVLHAGRGDLVVGEYGAPLPGVPRAADRPARVAAWFERAGVRCRASADVRAELWTKLTMNAVFNAISAVTGARYGRIVGTAAVVPTLRELVAECVAVARADGVTLADVDSLHASALALGAAMAGATSSTQQDLAAGRPTEIDALNGYVVRRGEALGVPVPVNRALWALVGLAEGVRDAG